MSLERGVSMLYNYIPTTGLVSTQEILEDKKKNGKKRGWNILKRLLEKYVNSLHRLGRHEQARKAALCANVLKFLECDHCKHKKLIQGYFCHDPLCPICLWRKSLAYRAQLLKIMEAATSEADFKRLFNEDDKWYKEMFDENGNFIEMEFISLTLTIRNVFGGKELKKAFKYIREGFNRLSKDKNFEAILGWVRSFEVTCNDKKNSEWYGSYHPHVHVLLAIPKGLLSMHKAHLLNKFTWIRVWKRIMKKVMGMDYEPSVDVHEVYAKNGQTYYGAALETVKYMVKSSDYIHKDTRVTDRVVSDLLEGTKALRRVGFGKIFKEIKARLKLQDIESEKSDLVGASGEKYEGMTCVECQSGVLREVIYAWQYTGKVYTKMVLDMTFVNEVYWYQRL